MPHHVNVRLGRVGGFGWGSVSDSNRPPQRREDEIVRLTRCDDGTIVITVLDPSVEVIADGTRALT